MANLITAGLQDIYDVRAKGGQQLVYAERIQREESDKEPADTGMSSNLDKARYANQPGELFNKHGVSQVKGSSAVVLAVL